MMVFYQLMEFLDEWGCFEPFHAGLRVGHSMESALLTNFFNWLICNVWHILPCHLLTLFEQWARVSGLPWPGWGTTWPVEALVKRLVSLPLLLPIFPGGCRKYPPSALLFSLYLLPLGAIFWKHKVSFQLYADHCQILLPFETGFCWYC